MSLLTLLPDDIYKNVLTYVFRPSNEIKRWNKKTSKWTDLQINRCYVCKAPSTKVALAHLCDLCDNDNCCCQYNTCCDNQLICFSCAY
jgi:hypothetical protein